MFLFAADFLIILLFFFAWDTKHFPNCEKSERDILLLREFIDASVQYTDSEGIVNVFNLQKKNFFED